MLEMQDLAADFSANISSSASCHYDASYGNMLLIRHLLAHGSRASSSDIESVQVFRQERCMSRFQA